MESRLKLRAESLKSFDVSFPFTLSQSRAQLATADPLPIKANPMSEERPLNFISVTKLCAKDWTKPANSARNRSAAAERLPVLREGDEIIYIYIRDFILLNY